MNNGIFM